MANSKQQRRFNRNNNRNNRDQRLYTMVSDLVSRANLASLAGLQFSGDRDLYAVLGYKRDITPEEFHAMYQRNGIAKRVINAFPAATWRGNPTITEQEERKDTAFELAIDDLNNRSRLWHYCERADRLCGIGRYSLLVLGTNDGQPQTTPLQSASELLWLLPVSERFAQISQWENNVKSPRFGKPLMYSVMLGNEFSSGINRPTQTINIHHSRVLHISEDCSQDDVYGTPRLESIYNNLFDLEKVVGGSAEMFWLGARQGLQFKARDDAQLTAADIDDMEEMVEEYHHKLRRMLASEGGEWGTLGSETPDPSGNFDVQLKVIAGATGIPQRILIGNEAGELASTTDENSWLSRIQERRLNFAEPVVIRPMLSKLIEIGILPAPGTDDYLIDWPTNQELGENIKADIATKKAAALATYANSLDASTIVTREEFREDFLGLPPEPPGGFPEEEEDELDQELRDILGQQPGNDQEDDDNTDDEEADDAA